MKVKVKNTQTDNEYVIDESHSLVDMERACPKFFRVPHGKRETYHPHRGCLIVRGTVQFTRCDPERRTTVYLFVDGDDMLCVTSNVNSIAQAKRLIDRILEKGEYSYEV